MKKIFTLIFVLTMMQAAVDLAFGQKRSAKADPPRPAPRKEDIQTDIRGKFEGHVYRNGFFGMNITFPSEWIVQDQAVGEAIKQSGSESVKGKTRAVAKALDASMNRTMVLATASKDLMGFANNAVFVIAAEPSTPLAQFRTGTDYLRLSLQSFKRLQLPPDFNYSETLGNDVFGGESVPFIQINRTGYDQRIYAIYRKGYAIFFTLSYVSEDDLNTMRGIFRNSKLALK